MNYSLQKGLWKALLRGIQAVLAMWGASKMQPLVTAMPDITLSSAAIFAVLELARNWAKIKLGVKFL